MYTRCLLRHAAAADSERGFDPQRHEAVAHVESDEPEGTVIAEHQKAYRLHDRVTRPALVSVAKAKN